MTDTPPPAPSALLKELRNRLDHVDEEIVRQIALRFETVAQIIREKAGRTAGIRDADREREVLGRVESIARTHGISGPLLRKVFSEIIAHSVTRQASTLSGDDAAGREVVVVYQGSPLTFNHLAAQKYLSGRGVAGQLRGVLSVKDAIGALDAGTADLAFLNIENTAAGSLNQVYDVLFERDLHIVGEETFKVDVCLCAVADVPLGALTRVLSHPLALEQCAQFIDALPQARAVPVVDSAEAMRVVAEAKDPTQAAIGSAEAAEAFGLHVLRRAVGNQDEILNRYVALARAPQTFDPRVPCKTSLIMSTRHEHGALVRCLAVLSGAGLSLTKIESRPRPNRPWEYLFFIDFEGHVSDPRVSAALDELRGHAVFLKILGCYPAKATPADPVAPGVRRSQVAAAPAPEAPPPAPPTPTPAPIRRGYRLADRASRSADTVVRVGDLLIGGAGFAIVAGPSSVESAEQIDSTARFLRDHGAHILRGATRRPRTSPYAFQGLGEAGLDLLVNAGKAVGLPVAAEIATPDEVRPTAERADLLQIDARNMQNTALLKEAGRVNRPVLLERGPSSTIDEWLAAAEYVLAQGNGQVILCERGIRTFERATRTTLDLSAVPVLRERTHLPVLVHPNHATGQRAYVAPMAWAARACGAHGVVIDVHPDPAAALSHGPQSVDFAEFDRLIEGLGRWRA